MITKHFCVLSQSPWIIKSPWLPVLSLGCTSCDETSSGLFSGGATGSSPSISNSTSVSSSVLTEIRVLKKYISRNTNLYCQCNLRVFYVDNQFIVLQEVISFKSRPWWDLEIAQKLARYFWNMNINMISETFEEVELAYSFLMIHLL